MKIVQALLIGVLSLTRAETDKQALAPFKFRVNGETIKKMFRSRDQEIFNTFTDTPLTAEADSKFTDLQVSIHPQTGEQKDFDFNLSIKSEDVGA